MKRFAAMLLALCLLLGACGGNESPAQTTAAPTVSSTASIVPTTQPPTEAPTEAPTEVPTTQAPTEPSVLYRHPLTGEPLDAPWTGRATAVSVDNIQDCMPQHGISAADIVYEVETEGGITRLLAVFTRLEEAGKVGPIRSTRTFFNNIAVSYDATLIHCGGSKEGLIGHFDDSGVAIDNWAHVNEQTNASYFFRDQERLDSGKYASWDTLFTTGENVLKALADKNYNITYADGTDFGLQFSDEVVLDGTAANKVTITFRLDKQTIMTYQAETGLYEAAQYGQAQIDANTGAVKTYRNVLVLYTDHWYGEKGRSFYDLLGSGEGVFACGGKLVPIRWTRENLREPFTYTLSDGTPLTLGTGTSYVGIVSSKRTVEAE